jgi:hypothetical protein
MPIIVEDGSGLDTATSYVSVAEADAYFLNHPYYSDNWDAISPKAKENFLSFASTQLDSLINWRGVIMYPTQSLAWPRFGVVDDEGRLIPADSVPQRVKNAVFELALQMSRGDQFAISTGAELEKLKIDVIELQFAGSKTITPVPAATLLLLKGLGDYAFGMRVRKVLVG